MLNVVSSCAGIFLHDPTCFAALIKPQLFEYKNGAVRVETQGICTGHTLMDFGLKKCVFLIFHSIWSFYDNMSFLLGSFLKRVLEGLNYTHKLPFSLDVRFVGYLLCQFSPGLLSSLAPFRNNRASQAGEESCWEVWISIQITGWPCTWVALRISLKILEYQSRISFVIKHMYSLITLYS